MRGRPLSYSAESSDASVLTVAMSGPVLTIDPLTEGTATVSIRATDPGGNSATITIPVTVNAPAHPDEFGWTTISGTERGENSLCTYTPVESGLYRMVGDVTLGRDA